jgi:hypothetical protein
MKQFACESTRTPFGYLIAALLLTGPTASTQAPSGLERPSANELVQQAVDNDLKALDQDHSHWMYRQRSGKGEDVEVVETKEGYLRRVIARNGQRLTDEQQASEDREVEKFVNDSAAQQKQQHAEIEDTRKTRDLFTLLPKALIFSDAGYDANTIRLNFQPNPAFHAPSREAHVFHEMEGQLIVDRRQKRIVEFGGHLTHEVRFGILDHLDQGGTFDVHQEEVAPTHWKITLLKINMRGKALFFKTISVQQDESDSRFRQVSGTLTLAQAVDLLRKQGAD